MALCVRPMLGFPGGPMINNMPLQFPSGAAGARRWAQVRSGFLTNVDGVQIPYNPYIGMCNVDNLQEVVPNRLLSGQVTTLGAIATAPRVYV